MISAKEAREQAENYKSITKFKADIEKEIQKAIENGKFCTTILIDCKMPDSIRDRVKEELKELGYKAVIPKFEEDPPGCPSDHMKYWDRVLIS